MSPKRSGPTRNVVWIAKRAEARLGALPGLFANDPGALKAGRVFVGGQRVLDPERPVLEGERVEVYQARIVHESIGILGERAGVIAVHKPSGIPTLPDRTGESESLIHLLAAELKVGADQLHALGRLDVGVSGVVLVARDRAARLFALQARAQGRIERRYVALAFGCPAPAAGRWQGILPASRAAGRGRAHDARVAQSLYSVVAQATRGPEMAQPSGERQSAAMLALWPVTGRFHQLRVHAAQAGIPLLGDRVYGGPKRLVESTGSVSDFTRVALHAATAVLSSESGDLWQVVAPFPLELRDWWRKLGGADEAWGESLSVGPPVASSGSVPWSSGTRDDQ